MRAQQKTLPRLILPSPVRYIGDLSEIAAAAERIVAERLEPLWDYLAELERTTTADSRRGVVRTDADDTDGKQASLWRRFRDAMDRIRQRLHSAMPPAWRVATRMVAETESAQRAAMNQQFRAVVPVDVFADAEPVAPLLRKAVRENIALIESIPQRLHAAVEQTIGKGIAEGKQVRTMRREVQREFGVSRRRAQLIARDQVGKLSGALQRERQQALGVTTYRWSTSNDERVRGKPGGRWPVNKSNRGDHWRLHNTTQRWDDPPVVEPSTGRTAHPGQDYQCRCQALANIADVYKQLGLLDEAAE